MSRIRSRILILTGVWFLFAPVAEFQSATAGTATAGSEALDDSEIPEDVREQLRALGYLGEAPTQLRRPAKSRAGGELFEPGLLRADALRDGGELLGVQAVELDGVAAELGDDLVFG
jgi:hypothetical protein